MVILVPALIAPRQPCRRHWSMERTHPHGLPASGSIDAVILPAERHAAIVGSDQPAVRDGDAVRVAREIAQHGFRSGERLLAIDDPLDPAQRRQEPLECLLVRERREVAEELQAALRVRIGEQA